MALPADDLAECVLTIFICSTVVQTRHVSMYLNKIDFAMLQCKRSMYVVVEGGPENSIPGKPYIAKE